MRNPEAHHQAVQAVANDLLARHVITEGEHQDMADLADAALMHAREELAGQLFELPAIYDVVDPASAELVGVITTGTYLRQNSSGPAGRASVEGLVRYNREGQLSMVTMSADDLGPIRGLTWTTRQGRVLNLVKVGQYEQGRRIPYLRDLESCRLALDQLEALREEGLDQTYPVLQQALAIAPFGLCPACRDRFELRDDCERCGGDGIVSRTE
ncbi:hypothetical protein [Pseudomonas denitrificans (nom. rej.)]|uniref:Uncharacterized protein n=1 Tax=Pseudomonas denitrificans TaxID=43306 RepID=A0A9X7N302_PSEDE|nr:hypothetical protein [Pseudomonas denitrificans (nom. rej.)]QEY74083.1 hypothetical protein F1C79_22115 [Pseudomonas denitrificans (nom. rej.)]